MWKLLILFAIFLATNCSVLRENDDELKVEEADYTEIEIPKNLTDSVRTKTDFKEDEPNLEKIKYDGFQLWKVEADSKTKLRIIGQMLSSAVQTWGVNRTNVDILVHPGYLDKVGENLKNNSIDYKIVMEDVQKAIDEENPINDEEEQEFQHRYGHRMTFSSYHRLSDIHNYLDYLAETYPSFCKVQVIGYSTEGRPLKLIKISNGNPGNKAVWIDGGIHAREWITPATVTYIVDHLVNNIETESKTIQDLDYYVVPVLNPDGYEYSHTRDRLWRKNRAKNFICQGTDLNRNYGYKWGTKGSGKNSCLEIYAGTAPFSEPETQAVKRFVSTTNAIWKASISYHSYGQYILFPWGYDRFRTEDHEDLQRVATKAAEAIRQSSGSYYTTGPAAATLYPASGGSDDWAKGAMKMKYAYTIELRDNGRYGFVLPASYIIPTAKEGLEAFRVIAEAAGNA